MAGVATGVETSAPPVVTQPATSAPPIVTQPVTSAQVTSAQVTSAQATSAQATSAQATSAQVTSAAGTSAAGTSAAGTSAAQSQVQSNAQSSAAQSQAQSSTITVTVPNSVTNPLSTSTVTVPAASDSAPAVSTPVTTAATSAIFLTTTDASGRVVTTAPPTITQTSLSTNSDGHIYTVTQIVRNPTGSLNDGSGSSGSSTSAFFKNTGAVVGVFVVVGIAGAAILLGCGFLFFRRRRRQKLDRDVAAAAAAANAAAQRTPFEDDEDGSGGHTSYTSTGASGPAMTQYGGYYASGSGPGGYDYEQAGGYDPYAAGAAGGVAAGGVAGAVAYHDDNQQHGNNGYAPAPSHTPTPQGGQDQYYLDPNEFDYDRQGQQDPYAAPVASYGAAGGRYHSNGSEGSVVDPNSEEYRRGALKITNPSDE